MRGRCGRLGPVQRHLTLITCERIPGFTPPNATKPGNEATSTDSPQSLSTAILIRLLKHSDSIDQYIRQPDDVITTENTKICKRKQKTAAILVYQEMAASMAILRERKKILILLLVCTQAIEMPLYYKVNRYKNTYLW